MGFDVAETDRLLTTTRSVRRRLDRTRPVDIDLLKRCLEIAVQAPTGSKLEDWRWLVVTDPVQRQRIGEIYADASMRYLEWWRFTEPDLDESSPAVVSARVLWEHLDEVPALMFPCFRRHGWHRSNPNRPFVEASVYGSIFPAVWSFQLACHFRGLGSCLITGHLNNEQAVADILGLPDDIGPGRHGRRRPPQIRRLSFGDTREPRHPSAHSSRISKWQPVPWGSWTER